MGTDAGFSDADKLAAARFAPSVSDLVAHELAPVRMLLEEAASVAAPEAAATLREAARHLEMVAASLPDLLGSASPVSSEQRWEPLGEALSAAMMFCRDEIDVSGAEDSAGVMVPAPNTRIALRNILSNASRYTGGASSVHARYAPGGMTISVREMVAADAPTCSSGSGLGLGVVDLMLSGCGGRMGRTTHPGGRATTFVEVPARIL